MPTPATMTHSRREFLQGSAAAVAYLLAGSRIRAEAGAPAGRMGKCKVPQTDLEVSRIAFGTSGLVAAGSAPLSAAEIAATEKLVRTAFDSGITLYDHADIYGQGRCERAVGEVLKRSPGLRDKIVLQSKCGQVSGPGGTEIDLSYGHIVSAAEGSLRRLGTDRLDLLLLHVADSLVEPEEVAKAFDELKERGKVRYFGVSNYTASEISVLKQSVRQPLVINQVPVGLGHPNLIIDGMEFALSRARVTTRPFPPVQTPQPGTFNFCRAHRIQIQAYSPVRGALLKPGPHASPALQRLAQAVADLAGKKGVAPPAIALAWLLRHPAGIVPILGTRNPRHLVEDCAADRVELTHPQWYELAALAAVVAAEERI